MRPEGFFHVSSLIRVGNLGLAVPAPGAVVYESGGAAGCRARSDETGAAMAKSDGNPSFMGYRRDNGRVGVRNHVLVLPVDDLSNAACEAVARNVAGTVAIPHAYGRAQFGRDLETTFRILIGTGRNPNVAAAVVIGIEPGWTQRMVEGIADTGKPALGFSIERHGDLAVIAEASRAAARMVIAASEQGREECPMSDLWVALKCGESDTTTGLASNPAMGNTVDRIVPMGATVCFAETSEITGAEDILAARAATPEAGRALLEAWSRYNDFIVREKTDDLAESQPTRGNIIGGLTTIEEKALGNILKIGRESRFEGVVGAAEAPPEPGLWFMDGPSPGAECVTSQGAGEFAVHLFTTGQGNVVGHPIMPVVKITANPITARTMAEHMDLNVSGILRREMDLDEAGGRILDLMMRVAGGRLTAAEVLGHREFSMHRVHPSA